MGGLIFLMLWPLMGLLAFLSALLWYLVRRPATINAARTLKNYLIACLLVSSTCAIIQAVGWFSFTHDYGDFLFYGPLMTWPVILGLFLGWIIGYWIVTIARYLIKTGS
jgi:hypothetical protein